MSRPKKPRKFMLCYLSIDVKEEVNKVIYENSIGRVNVTTLPPFVYTIFWSTQNIQDLKIKLLYTLSEKAVFFLHDISEKGKNFAISMGGLEDIEKIFTLENFPDEGLVQRKDNEYNGSSVHDRETGKTYNREYKKSEPEDPTVNYTIDNLLDLATKRGGIDKLTAKERKRLEELTKG